MNFIKKARTSLRLEKGVELLQMGRYEESLECFEFVLNSSSLNMLALYNKGLAYYYMKRYEDAIECFDTLINIKNKESKAALAIAAERAAAEKTVVGSAPTKDRRPSKDQREKTDSITIGPDELLLPSSSNSLSNSTDDKVDLRASRDKLQMDLRESRDGSADGSSGGTTIDKKKSEKSNSKEDKKEKEKFDIQASLALTSNTLLVRGDSKLKLGRREEAFVDYEELLLIDAKDNTDVLVSKGYAYLRIEKFEEAHKAFDEALRVNQKCVNAWCGKGTVFLRTAQEYQALKNYNKVLSLNPDFREHAIDHGKVQVIVQSIQDRLLEQEKRSIQEFTQTSFTPKEDRGTPIPSSGKKMQLLVEYNYSKKRLDTEVISVDQLTSEIAQLINVQSPILLEYWDEDFTEWIDLDEIRYLTKLDRAKLRVKPLFKHIAENSNGNLYIKDITVGNLLGSGSYGEVYKGIWNGTTRVALKKLHQPYDFKTFASEVQVLMQLRHPNIVWFFGIFNSSNNEYYIVMEFLNAGNLRDFLIDKKDTDFPTLIHLGANACAGMLYLSSHGIVHRDLSARNLLVKHEDGRYVVKVADFGLSRVVESDYYYASKRTRFPLKWTAVEAIKYGKYSTKSDVWSFGIVLWEILEYGAEPYYGMNPIEVKEYILKGERLLCPHNCPDSLFQVLLKCWSEEPNQRPSFKDLFEKLRTYCDYKDLESKVSDDEPGNHSEEDLHNAKSTYI